MSSLKIQAPAPPPAPDNSPSNASISTDGVQAYSPTDSSASYPTAPEYSPITPKAQPAIPVSQPPFQQQQPLAPPPPPTSLDPRQSRDYERFQAPASQQSAVQEPSMQHQPQELPQPRYIPQPPSQPFSSEDSTDAIALRAAISSLQFQKKKAAEDIRTLELGKKQALARPEQFRQELLAGRMKEQKASNLGDWRSILDAPNDEDDDDDDDDDDDVKGHADPKPQAGAPPSPSITSQIETQTPQSSRATQQQAPPSEDPPFPPIPGPQNIVRTPHINWSKYALSPAGLDAVHEQQRRWPGSEPGIGIDRGREFSVAAPYSPWLDDVNAEAGREGDAGPQRPGPGDHGGDGSGRKDSGMVGQRAATAVVAPGQGHRESVSEHIMETRRGSARGAG